MILKRDQKSQKEKRFKSFNVEPVSTKQMPKHQTPEPSKICFFDRHSKHVQKSVHQVHHQACFNRGFKEQIGFSYFEFKTRLIRLGLSFQKQKQKFLYSKSQPTDFQLSITPNLTGSS